MRFIRYYNIVNSNIKLYLIVCEKLSPCLRWQTAPPGCAKSLILLRFSGFSLYFSGAPSNLNWPINRAQLVNIFYKLIRFLQELGRVKLAQLAFINCESHQPRRADLDQLGRVNLQLGR